MLRRGACLYLLLCLPSLAYCQSQHGITTIEIANATIRQNYTRSVDSTVEYLFVFNRNNSIRTGASHDVRPARVTVTCGGAVRGNPVLVVLRQERGVLSWQLPLMVPTKNDRVGYNRTSRTICPNNNYEYWRERLDGPENAPSNTFNTTVDEQIIITISSSSNVSLSFTLILDIEEDFIVSVDKAPPPFVVNPSEPKFYQFKWGNESTDPHSVVLQVDSDSDLCMVVSIQNITCPVFDLERTVQFEGYRQTVTTRGGITLTRSLFPKGFYIVFVVKGDDFDCTEAPTHTSIREKKVTFSFKPSIGYDEYFIAAASAFFMYLSFYVVTLIVSVAYYFKKRNNPDYVDYLIHAASERSTNIVPSTSRCDEPPDATPEDTISEIDSSHPNNHEHTGMSDDSSLDETDIDTLADASIDKDVIRTKRTLYVCDLARKNPKILRKKSLMYFWNLLTVATFYALPVVQLVLSSQAVLKQTGNQDLCYYNFLCAYPLGFLSDFNHVFSNIGYFMLGFLFVILVYRRDRMHCNATAESCDLDKSYGIPQHYGLLYAMGAALMMEGILSGCYHVCPNHSNFQFDTSFMYVISLLCMLKIYHTRHPDINASAYATFGVLALIILVGVAGILSGTPYFWAAFTVLHLSTCLWLSGKVYYMGRLRLGSDMFRRAWNLWCREIKPNPCAFFRPRYPSRMVLLILGNMANWALAAVVWIYHLKNSFGTYLLAIFMANLMLYTIFYIVMKILCRERLLPQPVCYLILATAGWGFSLYFFFNKSISWAVTPALSRGFNQPCRIMNFYDNHDIWHFLSAFSMFCSFMTLLTLDDDLVFVHRSEIPVF